MSEPAVLYSVEAGVATLTMNRPQVLNALNDDLLTGLRQGLARAKSDAAVRAVLLTGAGRGFCAGADLAAGAIQEGPRDVAQGLRERYHPIILAMRQFPKPIVGAVNGSAAGAGMSIALACDLRIASEKAKFIEVFVRVGLVPDSGSSFFLPRLVGMAKAMELCLLGDECPAEEALRLGLVNRVVPADQLAAATREWAARLAAGPGRAYAVIKRQLNRALTADLDTILEYEVYGQEAAGQTADHAEALAAFVEKRPAVFRGE